MNTTFTIKKGHSPNKVYRKIQVLSDEEEDDEELDLSSPDVSQRQNVTLRAPAKILSSSESDSELELETDVSHELDDTDVNKTIDFEEGTIRNRSKETSFKTPKKNLIETENRSSYSIDHEYEVNDKMPNVEEVISSDSEFEFDKKDQIISIDSFDNSPLNPVRRNLAKKSIEEVHISDNEFIVLEDNELPGPSKPAYRILKAGPKIISPPKINLEEYNRILSNEPEKRLFGGKMTDERMDKVKTITEDVINSVHSSLNTAPENELAETPKGLRVDLMRHQKMGLSWLLWREKQKPPSGILADDMGLGKTLSTLALILENKNRRLKAELSGGIDSAAEKIKSRALQGSKLHQSHATLVIAPASLIYQWEKEVKDRIKEQKLSVYIFHGPKRQRDCGVKSLSSYDLVITTYQTVASELSEKRMIGVDDGPSTDDDTADFNSPSMKRVRKSEKKVVSKNSRSVLSKIAWERIVLDEAHQIKNRNSLASRAVCRLVAIHRWCLTGTPIHNELWDLFSLIRFLRVAPFDEEKMWKEFIMISTRNNTERLNTLVKGLLLRRTKNQMCLVTNRPLVELQERRYEIVTLQLKNLERQCYDIMFAASKQKVRDLLKNQDMAAYGIVRRHKKPAEVIKNPFLGGSREINVNDRFQQMSSVLVLLLRLRQACVHMGLTRNGVDMEAFSDIGNDLMNDEMKSAQELSVLEESFINLSLGEDEMLAGNKKAVRTVEQIFEPTYISTKMESVLKRLHDVLEAEDKCVIVSQWTTLLGMLEMHLKNEHIKYTSITGAIQTKDRQERIDSFNTVNDGAQVMLLSLTAGGVGLNLVGGNHLFLLDLHWNPALEQQACDRIYRMGQQKNVFIHKFLCDGTIERRVLELQEKKMALAKSVLEGAAKRGKLTMTDLKFLFELDNRTAKPLSQQAKGITG